MNLEGKGSVRRDTLRTFYCLLQIKDISADRMIMRILFLILITAGTSLLLTQSALCKTRKPASTVSSIEADYADAYEPLEPGDSLIVQKTNLASDPLRTFLIVASKWSCGAHGCENAIYEVLGKDSFRRIGVISGSITPTHDIVNGYKTIQVNTQDATHPGNAKTEQIWTFEHIAGEYLPAANPENER